MLYALLPTTLPLWCCEKQTDGLRSLIPPFFPVTVPLGLVGSRVGFLMGTKMEKSLGIIWSLSILDC